VKSPVWRQLFFLRLALMLGVGYAAFTHHGFWWALVYGVFAEEWLAFRLAAWVMS